MNPATGLSEWNRAHLVPGLCSSVLGSCSVQEVAAVAADAGLAGIEWDTGVHVVDEASAEQAARVSADADLTVLSLASGYRLGTAGDFSAVTALALRAGAPRIRVWTGPAGAPGSGDASALAVEDAKRISDLAAEQELSIALQYHDHAPTGPAQASLGLLEAISRDNVGIYWLPALGLSDRDNVNSLRQVLPFLAGVRCFSQGPGHERLSLDARAGLWESVAEVLHEEGLLVDLMLDAVQHNFPAQVLRDADFLNQVLLRED